jgi:hypothetical protein
MAARVMVMPEGFQTGFIDRKDLSADLVMRYAIKEVEEISHA